MSFKENYDKVFLLAGGVFGLVGAGIGVMTYLGMDDRYSVDGEVKSREIILPGLDKTDQLMMSLTSDHQVARPKVGAHYFDVFVAPELWLKKGGTVPIDIYAEQAAPVHPPIPNVWFMENKLSNDFKYSDAATRDSDGDGFTNLEEFEAKTNPSDSSSHPSLIKKLALTDINVRAYRIIFSQDIAPDFGFKATTVGGADLWRETVKLNGVFGKKPADVARFRLKEVANKEFQNKSTGVTETEAVAIVEDLKPTKQGVVYEIRKGSKYPATIQDRTAEFTVVAGSQSKTAFKVEEGKSFKIPGDDKAEYLLESIDVQSGTAAVKQAGADGSSRWNIKKQ